MNKQESVTKTLSIEESTIPPLLPQQDGIQDDYNDVCNSRPRPVYLASSDSLTKRDSFMFQQFFFPGVTTEDYNTPGESCKFLMNCGHRSGPLTHNFFYVWSVLIIVIF